MTSADGKDKDGGNDLGRALTLCSFYGIMSIWSVLSNKWIMIMFPHSNLLLLFQCVTTVIVLSVLKSTKQISAPQIGLRLPFSHKNELVVSALYTVNVVFGLWSLKFLSVPMYGAIKRSNLLVTLMGEYFILNSQTGGCALPVVVMMLGTAVAGAFDAEISTIGTIFGLVSSVGQGISLVYSKLYSVRSAEGGDSTSIWGVLYFNAMFSIVFLSAVIVHTGELDVLMNFPWTDKMLLFHLLINGLSIMLLNYSMFLNANLNSPLTVSVTGNVKVIGTTVFGVLLFQKPVSLIGGFGLVMNFIGAAGYSFVKYQQKFGNKLPTLALKEEKEPPITYHNHTSPQQHNSPAGTMAV